jgi:hypothetical protein
MKPSVASCGCWHYLSVRRLWISLCAYPLVLLAGVWNLLWTEGICMNTRQASPNSRHICCGAFDGVFVKRGVFCCPWSHEIECHVVWCSWHSEDLRGTKHVRRSSPRICRTVIVGTYAVCFSVRLRPIWDTVMLHATPRWLKSWTYHLAVSSLLSLTAVCCPSDYPVCVSRPVSRT